MYDKSIFSLKLYRFIKYFNVTRKLNSKTFGTSVINLGGKIGTGPENLRWKISLLKANEVSWSKLIKIFLWIEYFYQNDIWKI